MEGLVGHRARSEHSRVEKRKRKTRTTGRRTKAQSLPTKTSSTHLVLPSGRRKKEKGDRMTKGDKGEKTKSKTRETVQWRGGEEDKGGKGGIPKEGRFTDRISSTWPMILKSCPG